MLDLTAVTPQLNYTLGNPGAPGTIFVSSKASDNQLSLVMSSTVAASFTAGTLVPPGDAMTGTGSLLYLNLTPLGLTDAEFNALELTATGWTFALYSGASGQYVGFTPTGPVSLPPSPATISLALGDFTMATAPGSAASLSVLAYRVTGVTSGNFPVSGSIGVVFQVPDDNTGDLTAAIQVSLSPAQVVNTNNLYPEVDNQLVLSLTQQPNQPTVKSGADTAFTLNFVYSTDPNGYGALLTTAEGKAVTVTAAQGTTSWTITPNLNADPPNWTLTPPPNTALFGSGVDATIAFAIGRLVTTFQPGPTVVLIGYSNVPGCKNGSFAVTLVKQPHVVINSFQVTPQQSVLTGTPPNASATVTLSWSTTNATQLTLQPIGRDVTGQTSCQETMGDTTRFTLVAEGQRPGNVDNTASSSVVAQVLPVINSFTASPPSVYSGDLATGCPVTFAWNVNSNETVTLASATGPVGANFQPIGSTELTLSTPQTVTLKTGAAGGTPVSRDLLVPGFQMTLTNGSPIGDAAWVAVSPDGRFAALSGGTFNQVSIIAPTGGPVLATLAVGNMPVGIAFSGDSTLLYVGNLVDNSVSVFNVDPKAVSFTPAATVHFGGTPWGIVAGPDASCYVAVDNGDPPGSVSKIVSVGGTFQSQLLTTVGNAPRGIAIAPNGDLFVANSGGGTISRIATSGPHPTPATFASGLAEPWAVAVTPDGEKLLVTSGNAVYAYRIRFPAQVPQSFALPNVCWVCPSPTGTYAIATASQPNQSSGLIALLNLTTGAIYSTTIPWGEANPLGIAMAPDGQNAVFAITGGSGLVAFPRYSTPAAPEKRSREGRGPRLIFAAMILGLLAAGLTKFLNRAAVKREDRP